MGLSMPWATEEQAFEGLKVLVGDVTGSPASTEDTANAAVTVLSYAAAKGVRITSAAAHADPKAELRALVAPHHEGVLGDGTILRSLPWDKIIPAVIQILQIALGGGAGAVPAVA